MSAEWCQIDDIILHWEGEDGEKSNIRSRFAGLTLKEVMQEWHRHRAGNVRLQGNTDRPHILVIGPPCAWRVERIEGTHGYTLDQDTAIEYAPNQSVVFTMSKA